MKDSTNNKYFLDPNLLIFLMKRGMPFNAIAKKLTGIGKIYTDVKGLQEIVYYYHLMGETAIGYENAMALRKQVEVLSVTNDDILLQESLLDRYPAFPPRELLHSAVMFNNKITKVICSPESLYNEIDFVKVEPVLSKLTEQL
jgi:hypothetical protein